jgi:hypothetical protein
MNIALFILLGIIVVAIISLLFINTTNTVNYANVRGTVILQNTNVCSVNQDKLVTVDTTANVCCYNNNLKTGAFRVDVSVPSLVVGADPIPLEFSVIPVQTYYINVCREYCSAGYTLTSLGQIQCNGETGVTQPQSLLANTCVRITAPLFPDGTPCRGSELPIAIEQENLLYPLHAKVNGSIALCPTVGPC